MKGETFECQQCHGKFPLSQRCAGYGKVVCSVECFRLAGADYKPNHDTNRGGGVGKNKIMI